MANVIFRVGTSSEFQKVPVKDVNTLYWLTDKRELYRGDTLFGTGSPATVDADGLMSAEDKKTLNALTRDTVLSLVAVNGSIIISNADEGTRLQVGISPRKHNALRLDSEPFPGGLYVPEVRYKLVRKEDPGIQYADVYQLKCIKDGLETIDGMEIRIPKDTAVTSGELKQATEAGDPYPEAEAGDPYLDLTIANGERPGVCVPMKGLAGTFVEKAVVGNLGTARIINEGDGGCLYFKRTEDGKVSRVSVHDGSGNGVMAQIQGGTISPENRNLGTTISLFEDKATYRSQKNNAKEIADPKLELATVGDLDALVRKEITGEKGTARIFNEAGGGGAQFAEKDPGGITSFVGVNDGSRNGLYAQIYADRLEGGKWVGSRINVYHDRITYTSRKNIQNEADPASGEHEIATMADVRTAVAAALEFEDLE